MPSTVNGIGTHYYGRKNRVWRTAPCGSCHRVGNLESYDTRLWFVIVFIPIIPLGRKRIIDQCPSCTRHMAANADAYEQAKQLQTSGSLEQFRREPSPGAALGVHAQLLAFHEHDEAARFRASALDRFPNHAGLRVGLASHLAEVSSYDESARLFEEALKLEPSLPDARIGVARRRMAEGKLDEARKLLDFLEQPGAGRQHPLAAIDQLSGYYQRAGRHHEALEIAAHLLREIPEAGTQHAFRSFVRKSEKALGRPDSILPPSGHSLRGLFRAEGSPYAPWQRKFALAAAGLVLVGGGLLISNEYIRTHRTIHVVNACGQPVQVRVDDGPPQAISGLGRVVVGEGRHHLALDGPVKETHDIEVRSGYFERWTHKPAWVLNPGGEAVIGESTVHYAANPRPTEGRTIVGQPWYDRSHVDYAFESPPSSIQVKGKNVEVQKTVVEWLQGHDAEAFMAGVQSDREAAIKFAEGRLRRNPDQWELLKAYLSRTNPDEAPRVEALLKEGLARRPVVVPWHRAYQAVAGRSGPEDALAKLYDGFLAAEPASGALLYLRGRVEPDPDRQESFFRRSIEADPKLPWPWLALGVDAEGVARWDEALECFRKAAELKIDPDLVAESIHVARLAKGEAPALVVEYRARLGSGQPDPKDVIFLGDALAASGHPEEIEPAVTGWVNRQPGPFQVLVSRPLRAFGLYQAGKLAECEALIKDDPRLRANALRVHTLAALGRASEATDRAYELAMNDPWVVLSVALGLGLEGKAEEAARWRERAGQALEAHSAEARRAAKVLGRPDAPSPDEVARLIVDPAEKALIFAALGQRFPEKKTEYLAEAAKYNLRRVPPYHLLRRAIEGPAVATP